MPIESAKDLFVAKGMDLRHWHDVSSDIIKYLKDKLNRTAEAVVYKGKLANADAFDALEEPPLKGDAWTNEETGVNLMWNGEEWVPVSLFRIDFDKEPIEDSINGIQSGYIWKALQNIIDDPTIYRIVGEAENDPDVQDSFQYVSNILADILQDISDLNAKYDRIPEPIISPEDGNEIVRAADGGVYFNSDTCRLVERIERLESREAAEVEEIIQTGPDGLSMVVSEESPDLIFIEASSDVLLDFEPLPRTKWMIKHVYIESFADINLTFNNATYADVSEDPHYGQAGYAIFIRCTWIAGKIILEVLDNSQMAANVEGWTIPPESFEDPNQNDPDNNP